MIRKSDVEQVLNMLPETSFLRRYCLWASTQTVAAEAFHLLGGLSILTALAPVHYTADYPGSITPNMYFMAVTKSGAMKTSAMRLARKLLLAGGAQPILMGPPSSPQALEESLFKNFVQYIFWEEGKTLLAAKKLEYMSGLDPLLTQLWDGSEVYRNALKDGGAVRRQEHPRVNLYVACAESLLGTQTTDDDWANGFLGRFLMLYGVQTRVDPWPEVNHKIPDDLVQEVQLRFANQKSNNRGGTLLRPKVTLTPRVHEIWHNWYNDLQTRKIESKIEGLRNRAPTQALKIALALGSDYGPSLQGQDWYMDESILLPAIAITEMYISSVGTISRIVSSSEHGKQRNELLRILVENGGQATEREITARFKHPKRIRLDVIDALAEADHIVKQIQYTAQGTNAAQYMVTEKGLAEIGLTCLPSESTPGGIEFRSIDHSLPVADVEDEDVYLEQEIDPSVYEQTMDQMSSDFDE